MRFVCRSARLSPPGALVGPFCACGGVPYAGSTERMTQGPPRPCLGLLPAENARFSIENSCAFCTKSRVFRTFSASYSCKFARIRPGRARSRSLSPGAVDCIGCNADTFEGWPPGLFASTAGERINGITGSGGPFIAGSGTPAARHVLACIERMEQF